MQPPPQEIEAKLAIRDDATLRELRTLLARRTLGGYALRPHDAPEQQVNQYFDSADGRLRARLHGLRIRSVGDRHTLTLKGPAQVVGDIHARSEWEQPLERPSLDALPAGPLRDQVEQLSGGAPLHVVVTIHTQRSVIVVSRPSGKRALVEIALDDGRVEANGRSLELREVELELLPGGTRADLDALSRLLRQRFDLQPEARSKLQRALLLADLPPHPERTRAVAAALFDATRTLHGLGRKQRDALLYAADTFANAAASNAGKPEQLARDALLAADMVPLSQTNRVIAACIAALQHRKQRWRREAAMWRLSPDNRRVARRLAAILTLADAIARRPVLRVGASVDGEKLLVTLDALDGPATCHELLPAVQRWQQVFGEVTLQCGKVPAEHALPLAAPPIHSVGLPAESIGGGAPAAESARRLLRRQTKRLLVCARRVERDNDPEDVHQMRVAIRRLRTSLRVSEPLFEPKALKRLQKKLDRVAEALAPVRDLDVFRDGILAYLQSHGADDATDGETLLAAVAQARAEARRRLLAELGGKRYHETLRALARFVSDAGRDVRHTPELAGATVRDAARRALQTNYGELRAFGAAILDPDTPDEQLHKARIAGKRLRYAVELYADALGPSAQALLEALSQVQECFGAIQDAAVAHTLVDLLGMGDDPGARRYLAYLAHRRATGRAQLLTCWERVGGDQFQQLLQAALNSM